MPWTKRPRGLERLLPREVEATYHLYASLAHQTTRLCFPSHQEVADELQIDRSTVKRHARLIVKAGLIEKEVRPKGVEGRKFNDSNAYRVPEPTPEFIAILLHRGGVTGDPQVLNPENKNKQQQIPPTPRVGGGECIQPERVEPKRPEPSAELHQALQEARAARFQRKAERRQQRHSGARERKRHSAATPVQRAVRHVMTVLRVCPSLWATRAAIQTSVERWVQEKRVEPDAAANALIGRWLGYRAMSAMMEYPCGLLTWFGECRWLRDLPKHTHREFQRLNEAAVGSYQPTKAVDVAALREKMKALTEAFDGQGSHR
jgi:hypothetical protein